MEPSAVENLTYFVLADITAHRTLFSLHETDRLSICDIKQRFSNAQCSERKRHLTFGPLTFFGRPGPGNLDLIGFDTKLLTFKN